MSISPCCQEKNERSIDSVDSRKSEVVPRFVSLGPSWNQGGQPKKSSEFRKHNPSLHRDSLLPCQMGLSWFIRPWKNLQGSVGVESGQVKKIHARPRRARTVLLWVLLWHQAWVESFCSLPTDSDRSSTGQTSLSKQIETSALTFDKLPCWKRAIRDRHWNDHWSSF